MQTELRHRSADRAFGFALALGPLAWMMLAVLELTPAQLAWPMLLMVIVVRPVIEELVFRGLLQGWLRERMRWQWHGFTAANVLTSIAFVAAHLVYQPLAWALAVFIPSLVFGYFRDRHDSVLPSVILHVWYNAGFFLLPFLVY